MTSLALPVILPLFLIIVLLVVRSHYFAKIIGIAGSSLLLLISMYLFYKVKTTGIQVLYVGGWKAPFGISLVIDAFAGLMLIISSVIMLSVAIYALDYVERKLSVKKFFLFFFALAMGINGAFITGDAFNLYVWFEVILMSSFVLITMGSSREQLEGGIKYMAMNLLGSLLFLAGLGILYGKTGTLNMAHLADILRNDQEAILINTSAVLFFIAFGIKAAVFPLFFWLPASYHTANIAVGSLFAGILTKVGVYTLIRFFTLFFVQDQQFWHTLLLIVAGFTMLVGGLAASWQYETRKILSYHIISQIGYMIMGLGIFTPLGIAGAIFFTLHNMIAKTNTLLVSGVISKFRGTYYLKDIGGLFKQSPLLAILFIIPAFALAGFPPLSGFFAKFILIKAGIEDGHYLVTAVAVFTGLLTLYSMIKIWNEAFLKKQPEHYQAPAENAKLNMVDILPSVILGSMSLLMGIFAKPFFEFCYMAASQLIEPEIYIQAVLK